MSSYSTPQMMNKKTEILHASSFNPSTPHFSSFLSSLLPPKIPNLSYDPSTYRYTRMGLTGPRPNPEWCYLQKYQTCSKIAFQ